MHRSMEENLKIQDFSTDNQQWMVQHRNSPQVMLRNIHREEGMTEFDIDQWSFFDSEYQYHWHFQIHSIEQGIDLSTEDFPQAWKIVIFR